MKTTTHSNNGLRKLPLVLLFLLAGMGLKVAAQCHAAFTFAVDTANNGHITLVNTSTGTGPGATFIWSFGDGGYSYTYSLADTVNYTYNSSSTYNVGLTVYDDSISCRDSIGHAVTVHNLHPYCQAYFTTADTLNTIIFYDYAAGASPYEHWDFGDGDTSNVVGSQLHTYASPGIYYVCQSVHNADYTCSDTYCDSVRVSDCSAGFSATPDAVGFGYTFTSTVSGSGDTYYWTFGDGNTSTLASPYHVYAAPGYYLVDLYVTSSTSSLCNGHAAGYAYVNNFCDASFTMAQDSMDHYHYYIFANTTSSSLNYFWEFGDGDTSHAQYPVHNYAGTGPYYLCLTVTSNDSVCYAMHCDSLYAGRSSEALSVTVVNHMIGTGIQQQAETATLLENYPNPFSGSTTVHYAIAANAIVTLQVLDLLGNRIATLDSGRKQAGSYSTEWNAESVAQGMYLLQLNVDNKIMTKKIVISK